MQELRLARGGGARVDRRLWWLALACIVVAATFSGLDISGAMCDPDDHVLQGHAIWHVASATPLLAMFGYYRQLALREHREADHAPE